MNPARVLVAGDANLDIVLRGDVRPRFGQAEQLLEAADVVLGSSAGICAAGLARLGVQTALCARVGDDLFGRETLRLLDERGVDIASAAATTGPTGLSVILSAPKDRAILTLGGAMTTLTGDDVTAALERTRATHLHVAGLFLLPQLVADLPVVLADAHARGVTMSLDTNWDPEERWAGVAECLPHLDVLLPNAAEAVALARAAGVAEDDPLAAARVLADYGPIVVVKDGAAGGFAVSGQDVVHAVPPAIDPIDTTGAGDTFDAGFLGAWLAGLPLEACVRQAAAAGALSTLGAGGTAAQPTLAEVEAALA